MKREKIIRIIVFVFSVIMLLLSLAECITFAFFAPEVSIKESTANWLVPHPVALKIWCTIGAMYSVLFWGIVAIISLFLVVDIELPEAEEKNRY